MLKAVKINNQKPYAVSQQYDVLKDVVYRLVAAFEKQHPKDQPMLIYFLLGNEYWDEPMTRFNSIECNTCKRPYHLKCVDIRSSCFTCKNCDSNLDVSSEEE